MSEDERMPRPARADPIASRPEPRAEPPAVEPPSEDVETGRESSSLPGRHRGGFQRLPTAPVSVTTETAPAEPGTTQEEPPTQLQWYVPDPEPYRGLAGWALAFSIAGLIVSLFVGWGFPVGVVGVVSAILALRRPLESRPVAVWALVVGAVSILYSAGWLFYAFGRAPLMG